MHGLFEAFLKKNGLRLISHDGPDAKCFGNESVVYMGSNLRVTIIKERGRRSIGIGPSSFLFDNRYDTSLIKALIESGPIESIDLLEGVQFIEKNWKKIVDLFSRSQRRKTRRQLDALRQQWFQTSIASWPQSVLKLEAFLVAKGLTCQCREAPKGAFGPRTMIYSDPAIAVRMKTDRSWKVEFADLKTPPGKWYDVRKIRVIVLDLSDSKCIFRESLEFIQDNWDKIVDIFDPEKSKNTHRRLKSLS